MKNENAPDVGNYTDVRYSKIYSVIIVIMAIIFIILAIIYFNIPAIILLISGLALLVAGILAFRGRKYLRLDKQNKIVMIFGIFGLFTRKYHYDRIYSEGKELYIETNGKKKILNILRYAYDKSDFDTFLKEITS